MNRSSIKTEFNDDNSESDRLFPLTKRHCQSPNSRQCLSSQSSCVFVDLKSNHTKENKELCKSCGKQERLLKTFNCPSLHYFCLNCIFNWTQQHIQNKTRPICLVVDCGYFLKIEDLGDLPIALKDHQILLQLIELKIENKINNQRRKCDKCYLYIDQHNFYVHHNECLGRSLTIPCEICYCPVLMEDYEQHMLICNNDDNSTLAQFLFKHLPDANIEEKDIKLFIRSWQRKHRGSIDIYEMIEEFNSTNTLSTEICDVCKNTVRSDEFYLINCNNNHSLCLSCYKQHIQNQMNKNEILSCFQCDYYLQDKDLLEIRVFTEEQSLSFQNYQNRKIFESYNSLYGTDIYYTNQINLEQQNVIQPLVPTTTTTTNTDDVPRRKCELCSKLHSYVDIFLLNCNCKICYDCFANDVNHQRSTANELLICSLCRASIKHNDLGNLRLAPEEIKILQLYQQGKLFELEHAVHFTKEKTNNQIINNTDNNNDDDDFDLDISLVNQQQCLPKYWTLPMLTNFTRHTLDPQSTEYKFVSDKFDKSWANFRKQHAIPPPPPPPPSTSVPPSSVVAQINNYQPGTIPQFTPIPPPHFINRNHGLPTNQVPPFLAHNNYNTLPGFPPTVPHTLAPPPLPMPSVPTSVFPQQMYQYRMLAQPANGPPQLPGQRVVLRSRRTKAPDQVINTPTIIQIERIQNQRWFKQYSAHDCEFRQKLGKQTEQWLFHGCDERSSKNIELECFNRSYAGQHAVAFGQGCYFARDSVYSHSYSLPDRNGIRRMFLARVLVGNTTQGNSSMRVAPPGFDTTGDGQSIFVTYHDSQAYAEYLISYR
ncbi:unnamed protein product [Adineta steineri]|uniref:Poly [ADP-ribose] polymerase n=1 Tax=Adineta steineri TaxID=433720 RepID=A0A813NJB6_9BILA|nr:unnamed protein product [Adineta steineri]CAF3626292.1 unnamed protein product [Adineta steineri]